MFVPDISQSCKLCRRDRAVGYRNEWCLEHQPFNRKQAMKVPFIEFSKIYTENKEEILGALDRVLSGGELMMGDYGKDIDELEKWFAEYVGCKYAIMCGSGTQ